MTGEEMCILFAVDGYTTLEGLHGMCGELEEMGCTLDLREAEYVDGALLVEGLLDDGSDPEDFVDFCEEASGIRIDWGAMSGLLGEEERDG